VSRQLSVASDAVRSDTAWHGGTTANEEPDLNEYRVTMRRTLLTALVVSVITISTTACSDDVPEVTRADLLAEIEGRSLSEAEIEERESVARALCQMDDDVLRAVWAEMDNEQLAFQDFVFTQECGDRNPLYADSTGRFSTGE